MREKEINMGQKAGKQQKEKEKKKERKASERLKSKTREEGRLILTSGGESS